MKFLHYKSLNRDFIVRACRELLDAGFRPYSKNNLIPYIILLLAIVPIALPYLHKGYFPTHDGEWAVVRGADMYREIRDLQFPPRYSGNLNFGFGYPLFNFAYPGPYYLAFFLHVFRLGFVNSIKMIFFISVFCSAFFMYFFGKTLWKNTWSGVVCAIFYLYFPYRMVDLFVRGSIGESVAFTLFPLIFLCVFQIYRRKYVALSLVVGALLYGFLITTHNIMATFFTPLLFTFIVSLIILKKEKHLLDYLLMIICGIGISAFFWLPAVSEKHLILLSVVPIADRSLYFAKPLQLVLPSWGYGTPTDKNPFTYNLGIAHILSCICVFFLLGSSLQRKAKDTFFIPVLFFVFTFFGMILLLFSFTLPIWKSMPLLSEINYPWTLLGPIGFITSILSGYVFIQKNTFYKYWATLLAIIAFGTVILYAHPQYYSDKGDMYYASNDATTTSSSELMPLWVKSFPLQRSKEKATFPWGGEVETVFANSKTIRLRVTNNFLKPVGILRINTIYYPGWELFVDGKKTYIDYANAEGIMKIKIPPGEHSVTGVFRETRQRMIADFISIATVFVLLGYLITSYKKKNE